MRSYWHREYPTAERIYAIGDVQGQLDLLETLLHRIHEDNASRPPRRTGIVMLGNLIDHGPDTEAVLDLCMRLSAENALFTVLKGRQEVLMIAALRNGGAELERWLAQGGRATLRSMGLDDGILDALLPRDRLAAARQAVAPEIVYWLDALPDHWSAGRYLFRPSMTCSKSTLSPARQRLLLDDAAFTVSLTLLLQRLVRQKIMRGEMDDGAGDAGNDRPIIEPAAIGLERNRSWIVRSAGADDSEAPSRERS